MGSGKNGKPNKKGGKHKAGASSFQVLKKKLIEKENELEKTQKELEKAQKDLQEERNFRHRLVGEGVQNIIRAPSSWQGL